MRPDEAKTIGSPTLHVTIFISIAIFIICLTASMILRVEITAQGEGLIIPVERVQVVQPEVSAPVTAILVRDGASVTKGDLLVTLDATGVNVERELIVEERQHLRIESARLQNLLESLDKIDIATGKMPEIPFNPPVLNGIGNRERNFSAEQAQLLTAEKADVTINLRRLSARIEETDKAGLATEANIARADALIDIRGERKEAAEKLARNGTASRANVLTALESYEDAFQQRNVLLKQREQQAAAVSALVAERRALVTAQNNRIRQRRSEIDARLAALAQKERAAERQINGSRLLAPVSGTVAQMSLFTVGGIARAGEDLMTIVPSDGGLEVEAYFSNQDSGFLHVGQEARIRLAAFPAERFGAIRARVLEVSANSVERQPGRWDYVVRLQPETGYLDTPAGRKPLRPGMTAAVDVITGERTLISYFFAPIVDQLSKSLGER